MTPSLHFHANLPERKAPWPARHVLLLLPPVAGKRLPAGIPAALRALIAAALERRGLGLAALGTDGCVFADAAGTLFSVAVLAAAGTVFERGVAVRKALAPLLAEHPERLGLADLSGVPGGIDTAVYAALVNAAQLPVRKSLPPPRALKHLHVFGVGPRTTREIERMRVLADANTLARTLTLLPPNELHPGAYRADLRRRAKAQGWRHREYDLEALRRMKAGAFLAVAQGSDPADAAIVHLSSKPKGARRRLALVGKGICFDTGGHNLKTARGMFGMHEDMNGSAVALAAMQALVALQLPVEIHCLLAVAQNHLSPRAYKQNDVVTALNGTTIEIVHTDAEGRMVLADTLTLAAREQPDLIIDFATLTGSMITALGTLQSGVFASSPALEALARAASVTSGERVVCFPAEADYDMALESKVADVRQCLQEGEADHILAARFLNRFRGDADWLHVDLSCYRHEGGLGAVASDVSGFGVAWTCALVESWLAEPARAMTAA